MTKHEQKVMMNLVMYSVSNVASEAQKEWKLKEVVNGLNVCSVCGHKLKTEVWVKNVKNGNVLCVGVVCALTVLDPRETRVMLDAVEVVKRKANRLKRAMKDAVELDALGVMSGHLKHVNGEWVKCSNVEWVNQLVEAGKL